jgi:hypothetical protein
MVPTFYVLSLHTTHHTDHFPMERAQSPIQALRYAIEEPVHQRNGSLPSANVTTDSHGSFGNFSPLYANDARGEPDRFGHRSPLPANEDLSEQPLLNNGDIEMNEEPQHSLQSIQLPGIEAQVTIR